jgi:hypothetical protein
MAKMAEEAPHSPLPRREEGSSKVTGDNPKWKINLLQGLDGSPITKIWCFRLMTYTP